MIHLNEHSTQLASAIISKYFARFCPKNIEKTLKRGSALLEFVQALKMPVGPELGSLDSSITIMVMVGWLDGWMVGAGGLRRFAYG